jgi:hypothetical protein
MEERVIIICLIYFQQTTPPYKVNTYPYKNSNRLLYLNRELYAKLSLSKGRIIALRKTLLCATIPGFFKTLTFLILLLVIIFIIDYSC